MIKIRALLIIPAVFVFLGLFDSASSQEIVFRNSIQKLPTGGPSLMGSVLLTSGWDVRTGTPCGYPYDLSKCVSSVANASNSFTVYRTDQVDSKVKSLEDEIQQLKSETEQLKLQIKSLSEANDALTKRLDEVDTTKALQNTK